MGMQRSFSLSPALTLGVLLGGLLAITGCGGQPPVDQVSLDAQIEDQWMANREVVDAIEFFEKGGLYSDPFEESGVEKKHILPLLTRIRDELVLKPLVVQDDPENAMAVLIELPADTATRKRMAAMIQEADDAYDGLVMDHWGKKWLSFDWVEGEELEMLEEADALDTIIAEHQRFRNSQ